MKYLYTLINLLTFSFVFSQNLLVNGDFEDTTTANTWSGNAANIATYGDNSINESNVTVAGDSFSVSLFQEVNLVPGEVYLLTFTANTATANNGRVLRAGIGKNGGNYWTQWVDVTLSDTPQTFTLSFGVPNDSSAGDPPVPNRVLFEMGHAVGYIALDNVSLVLDTTTSPTAGPAAPTHDAADVISVFSDAYTTNVGLDNVSPWDGGSNFEVVDLSGDGSGDNVIKAKMQNFLGTQLSSGATDFSGMTHMHLDFWIANDYQPGQVFKTKLSNHSGGNGETNSGIAQYTVVAADSQTWVSLDFELANLVEGAAQGTGTAVDEVLQVLFDGGNYLGLVYMDNFYFYDDGSSGGGGETPTTTTYCSTEVTHFNIAGHANPLILTVENSGADSMTVTGSCPVNTIDVLIVNGVSGGGAASAATITNGVATIDLTWPAGTMPATTTFEVLWSDDQFGGNNMLKSGTGTDALGNIDTSNDCSTASVKDISFYNIDVYPNPASNVINVRSEFTIDNLSVLDLTGRTVKQQISNNKEFSLDVSDLSKGIYLVKLSSGDKEAVTKFIKK